jgi:hypothetical protein
MQLPVHGVGDSGCGISDDAAILWQQHVPLPDHCCFDNGDGTSIDTLERHLSQLKGTATYGLDDLLTKPLTPADFVKHAKKLVQQVLASSMTPLHSRGRVKTMLVSHYLH